MQIHPSNRTPRARAPRSRSTALVLATTTIVLLLAAGSAGARLVSPTLKPLVTRDAHLELVHLPPLLALVHRHRGRDYRAPAVTVAPQATQVAPGAFAHFSASAIGSPHPAAHWQISVDGGKHWRNIPGARGTHLSFMALIGQNGDEFRAVFVNKRGSAHTAPALLSVVSGNSAPLLVTQPSSETVASGATASFTAAASGDPAPTVQWEISYNGGGSWSAIAGAQQATLSFVASSLLSGDEFRAAFTNAVGSTVSDVATLTVTGSVSDAPTITEQPQDANGPAGQSVSFTASASGTPAPSVQWQVSTNAGQSWTAISGATSDTYSFTTTAGENLYEYEAVFSNSAGSATSEPAVLGVGYELAQNWSGYVASGSGPYTAVSATWVVPSVNCSSGGGDTYSSQWVGIDGNSDSTVEQDGTYADCDGTTPSYGAWYEMFGDDAVQGGAQVNLTGCTGVPSCTVEHGDSLTASVSVNGSGLWTLSVRDTTAPDIWSFSTTVSWTAPQESSAEWIVERPEFCNESGNCQLTPLADFSTVQLTNATASTSGGQQSINALGGVPIEMISSGTDGTLLAEPGALDGTGEIFTDTWYASS
ncbi:MAG: G1 family glutamic endopeptidase [Solirubrobacteraceae bacterium]|jgi:hypothetical protein